jgi:hypothetical protein
LAYAGELFLIPSFPQAFVDRTRKQPEYENNDKASYEYAHNSVLYFIVLALTLKPGSRLSRRFLARKVAQRLPTSPMIYQRFWPVGGISGNDPMPQCGRRFSPDIHSRDHGAIGV